MAGRQNAVLRGRFAIVALLILAPWTALDLDAQTGSRSLFSDDRGDTLNAQRLTASDSTVRRSREATVDVTWLAASEPHLGFTAPRAARSINLNLFRDAEFVAFLDHVETGPIGYAWVGTIGDIEGSQVILAVSDGVLAGSVNLPTTTYTIAQAGDGWYAVAEINRAALPRESAPLSIASSRIATRGGSQPAPAAMDLGDVFDLLLLYTPQTRIDSGGTAAMNALVTASVAGANTAYATSRIPVRLRLVGALEYAYAESGSTSVDLDAVQNSALARALRDRYHADLVTLVVSSADAAGQAFLMSGVDPDFAPFAFNVVVRYRFAGLYSFAHELGHNMGSNHAPGDAGNGTGAFPYSFGYKDEQHGFSTIMSYACATCERINQFSSSVVTYHGLPTGTALQDTARSITDVRTVVSNFRQADVSTSLGAPSGLTLAQAGSTVTLAWDPPVVGNPTGYRVEIGSATGLTDLGDLPTGSAVPRFGASGVSGGTYWLRVRATDGTTASGVSNEVVLTVGCSASPSSPSGLVAAVSSGSTVTLTWTPSAGATSYVLEAGLTRGSSNLSVTDIAALNSFVAVNVGPGVYFVRLRAKNACGISLPSPDAVVALP